MPGGHGISQVDALAHSRSLAREVLGHLGGDPRSGVWDGQHEDVGIGVAEVDSDRTVIDSPVLSADDERYPLIREGLQGRDRRQYVCLLYTSRCV